MLAGSITRSTRGQMGRQAAAIAMRALIRHAPRSALDHRLGSLLRSIQDALRDLHVIERQVILIWSQLLGLRAELVASQFAENYGGLRYPTHLPSSESLSGRAGDGWMVWSTCWMPRADANRPMPLSHWLFL